MKMKNGVFVFLNVQHIETYIFRILLFSWVRICIWFQIYCVSFEENSWSATRSKTHFLWSFCLPTEKSRRSSGEIVPMQRKKEVVWKPITYQNSEKIEDSNGVNIKAVGRKFIFHLHFFHFSFSIFTKKFLVKIFLVSLALQRYQIYFNGVKNVEVMMPYVKYCQVKTNRL